MTYESCSRWAFLPSRSRREKNFRSPSVRGSTSTEDKSDVAAAIEGGLEDLGWVT